jgi:hypothetical protein
MTGKNRGVVTVQQKSAASSATVPTFRPTTR